MEWSRSELSWTVSRNSSGDVAISVVKLGVNFVETEGELDSGIIVCIENMEWEKEKGTKLDFEDQCLKGKMDSLKTTSLETKQVLESKS